MCPTYSGGDISKYLYWVEFPEKFACTLLLFQHNIQMLLACILCSA